ncbi:hypothetical protein ACFV0H_23160 [Streptomyces erythrochromogenes]|uniref:Uncharacterized protein n=1 Tax=Streptomyces erythrochromogenes TaxID=285574 RepID=A0ABZ1Q7Z7_9ACTN|nr:hypothetical protein [Streptomyces erythrochromogenes]MCX5582038.1 hypothetical protein [Streptomyces erythrochromogenes]
MSEVNNVSDAPPPPPPPPPPADARASGDGDVPNSGPADAGAPNTGDQGRDEMTDGDLPELEHITEEQSDTPAEDLTDGDVGTQETPADQPAAEPLPAGQAPPGGKEPPKGPVTPADPPDTHEPADLVVIEESSRSTLKTDTNPPPESPMEVQVPPAEEPSRQGAGAQSQETEHSESVEAHQVGSGTEQSRDDELGEVAGDPAEGNEVEAEAEIGTDPVEEGPSGGVEETATFEAGDEALSPGPVDGRPADVTPGTLGEGTDAADEGASAEVLANGVEQPEVAPGRPWEAPLTEEQIADRISELANEGHATGRHLDVSDEALQKRLGEVRYKDGSPVIYGPNADYSGLFKGVDQVDPLTGNTTDGENPAKKHYCGPYSTRFDKAEDMVRADMYFRVKLDGGEDVGPTAIADILGPDAHRNFTGFYRDPANPGEFKPVDFEGGTIRPQYRLDDATGAWKLHTMMIDPAPRRHP